jgi:competence protein ComEA
MHGWRVRTAAIVTALMLIPWAAAAADKSDKADKSEKSGKTTTVSATVGSDAKVNVNTASVKELTTLAGVGPRLAERIVVYRETHGPFKKPEDMRKVEGVGKALWERNRERIVTK